jgi:L,D-peptidoglycan transpeptidase YkuD (ErfK/YbiS/YcfS/YnhG family)
MVLIVASLGSFMSGPVDSGGRASSDAVRDVSWRPAASCDLATVQALAGRRPGVRQFVVLATADFAATSGLAFVAARRSDGVWACQTATMAARFGRSGTTPLPDRRSGDGSTPAGVFPLGTPTAWDGQRFSVFGNSADPGVRSNVGYRRVRPQDCWGATPGTARYNKLVDLPGCPGPDDEWLPRPGDVYSHAAVIGANLDPISGDEAGEPALAAAIFLHRNSYTSTGATKSTSGCVTLDLFDLVTVIRLLDPALSTQFAIGPTAWLRTSG